MIYKKIDTPIGGLRIIASEVALYGILWPRDSLSVGINEGYNAILNETERQLGEYFAGQRTRFSLPLEMIGTDFQKKVWNALLMIPYGETRSYSELAESIGNPKAVRAVGAANGKNPISIVVPCHRVIGKSGKLIGFAGGVDVKRELLDGERPCTGQGHINYLTKEKYSSVRDSLRTDSP